MLATTKVATVSVVFAVIVTGCECPPALQFLLPTQAR